MTALFYIKKDEQWKSSDLVLRVSLEKFNVLS